LKNKEKESWKIGKEKKRRKKQNAKKFGPKSGKKKNSGKNIEGTDRLERKKTIGT